MSAMYVQRQRQHKRQHQHKAAPLSTPREAWAKAAPEQSSTGEPLPKRMRMLTLPTQPSTQALNASTQRANAPNAATYTTHEHHTHTRGTLLVSHKQCDRAVGGRAPREENRTKRAVLFLQRTVLKTRFLTVSHVIAGIDEKGFSVCFAVEGVGLRVSG